MMVTIADMGGQVEANKIKELVVSALVAEGYLDRAKAHEFLSCYCVVMRERGWFGRLIDKAFGEVKEGYMQYQVAKLVKWPDGSNKGEEE